MVMLKVENLSKKFKDLEVLKDIYRPFRFGKIHITALLKSI